MRLPVPPRDLRPDVRARHARHAVLHRLPAADRTPLRRRRRRRHRPGEGRGPAGLRRRRRADRARRASRSCRASPPRARSTGSGASTAAEDLERTFIAIAATNDTDVNIGVYEDAERARDARQRRRRPAAVQLHPARDRAHRPAGDRHLHRGRVARAGQAHQARDRRRPTAPEHARLAELLNDARGWAKGNLPTYQDRKAFFEGIVNGDPDPIALLRAGDEDGVRALIDAARATAPARLAPRGARRGPDRLDVRVRAPRRGPLRPGARRARRGRPAARSSRWRSCPTTSR